MTKLPTPQDTTPPDRAKLLGEGLARLRTATGTPERRIIRGVCSIQRKGFSVVFERVNPRNRFTISVVEKDDPGAAGKPQAGATAVSKAQTFKWQEFDMSGHACPWCGSKAGRIYHNKCDTSYCGGALVQGQDGEEFPCPTCKESLKLVQADEVQASSAPVGQNSEGGKLLQNIKARLLR